MAVGVEWPEHALKAVLLGSVLLMVVRYFTQGPPAPPSSDQTVPVFTRPSCSNYEETMRVLRARLQPLDALSTAGLRGVALFLRHGDRTPAMVVEQERTFWMRTLPADHFPIPSRIEERESTIFPFARLTGKGVCETFALGEWVRDRYKGLLQSQTAGKSPARFYSTEYERTARTASVIARGIGFTKPELITSPRHLDPLDPWESIPAFSRAVYDFELTNETFLSLVRDSEEAAREVYSALQGRYFKKESSFSWVSAYDLFACAEAHPDPNRPLDRLVQSPLKQIVQGVTLAQYVCLYRDAKLRRMAVGGLLGGLAKWIGAVSGNNSPSGTTLPPLVDVPYFNLDPDTRMAVVACHDVNLLPLKIALDWEDPPSWPEYGSFLAFEVYDEFVRIVDSTGRTREVRQKDFIQICKANLGIIS